MTRTVEHQLRLFAQVQEHGLHLWLSETWESFRTPLEGSSGRLATFLDEVGQSEPLSIFVPTRSVTRLSPGNPYAAASGTSGFYQDVEPKQVATSLSRSREQLAEAWMSTLDHLSINVDWEASESLSGGGGDLRGLQAPSHDGQLLRGMATRLAVRDMLEELRLLPSQRHVHSWLHDFCLLSHANDMTADGSVDRLLAELGAQPLHIRGGALVDPLILEKELRARTSHITVGMAASLKEQLEAEHESSRLGCAVKANFLEACFNVDPTDGGRQH